MRYINSTLKEYKSGLIDKPEYIKRMFEEHHSHLFDYANNLIKTNIKKIEIEDGNVIVTTRDRGVRIICSEGDYRTAPIDILNFSEYEKYEYEMVEKLINNGDNFFDIGANIGWYSINIGLAKRNSKIYSFEPIPKTYKNLQNNININFVKNITTHNFGLSNKKGEFIFYYYEEGSGNASTINLTERADIKKVQCRLTTLDEYIEKTSIRVDFIKCDVEGAELHVFQGGFRTIQRDLPIIFSEILRKWSAKFDYDPNMIFNILNEIGYQAFTVNEENLINFEKMLETTIETNFFFLHREKHAELIKKLIIK
jgi:FkbM family methyltransferase